MSSVQADLVARGADRIEATRRQLAKSRFQLASALITIELAREMVERRQEGATWACTSRCLAKGLWLLPVPSPAKARPTRAACPVSPAGA